MRSRLGPGTWASPWLYSVTPDAGSDQRAGDYAGLASALAAQIVRTSGPSHVSRQILSLAAMASGRHVHPDAEPLEVAVEGDNGGTVLDRQSCDVGIRRQVASGPGLFEQTA